MEYYLAIKKDFATCNNMDGPRGYYAKWNKSDRERQILYDFIYMESKKAKQMNKHNKTQMTNSTWNDIQHHDTLGKRKLKQ